MNKPWWMWVSFLGIVLVLLVLDLRVFHRKEREIGIRESLALSSFYITLSVLFGLWIWYSLGGQHVSEYYTGYLVELSLSMDNLFVMSVIFSYFAVPRRYQHRVLFWGILGVIVLRGIMIGLGAALVERFAWMLYVFSAFLIIVGIRMLIVRDDKPHIAQNPVLRFLKKHFRITHEFHDTHFLVKAPHPKMPQRRVIWITPLLVALLMIEMADLLFAVDSIPAIFAITTDPYIVYTSNIFAILGLRSMYFALSAIIDRFVYLQHALALVLIFIGSKIFLTDFLGLPKFPAVLSLGVTFALLAGGIILSLWKTRQKI